MSETVYIGTSILGYLTARQSRNLVLVANATLERTSTKSRYTLYQTFLQMSDPNTPTESEFTRWTDELEDLARLGVEKEIAQHKAHGNPIFYSRNGVPIMELADGRCFEYRRLKDGSREVICEVEKR